jgi:hypothetical protein
MRKVTEELSIARCHKCYMLHSLCTATMHTHLQSQSTKPTGLPVGKTQPQPLTVTQPAHCQLYSTSCCCRQPVPQSRHQHCTPTSNSTSLTGRVPAASKHGTDPSTAEESLLPQPLLHCTDSLPTACEQFLSTQQSAQGGGHPCTYHTLQTTALQTK